MLVCSHPFPVSHNCLSPAPPEHPSHCHKPHTRTTLTFPYGDSSPQEARAAPAQALRGYPSPHALPWSCPGMGPTVSPGRRGRYPAQVTRGRNCWYWSQKEGLSFQRQHQFCDSSSWSVEKNMSGRWRSCRGWLEGLVGPDDSEQRHGLESGPPQLRSHLPSDLR